MGGAGFWSIDIGKPAAIGLLPSPDLGGNVRGILHAKTLSIYTIESLHEIEVLQNAENTLQKHVLKP